MWIEATNVIFDVMRALVAVAFGGVLLYASASIIATAYFNAKHRHELRSYNNTKA